jgi:hypothetical protein
MNILSSSKDSTLKLWQTGASKCLYTYTLPSPVTALSMISSSSTSLLSSQQQQQQGQQQHEYPLFEGENGTEGKTVYASMSSGGILRVDLRTRECRHVVRHGPGIGALAHFKETQLLFGDV